MSAISGDAELRLAQRALKTAITHVNRAAHMHKGGTILSALSLRVIQEINDQHAAVAALRYALNQGLAARAKAKGREVAP